MGKSKRTKKKRFINFLRIILLFLIIILFFCIYNIQNYYDNNIFLDKNNDNGFFYKELSDDIINRITGITFPKEFDSRFNVINYNDLRYVKIKYYDFDGIEHNDGEMIVNKLVVDDVINIFYELYQNKYPINKILLVDEYNGNDELSMQDNNSSCFNYRIVENIDRLSWHAFGLAVDINPLYNPYVANGKIYPKEASSYVDRDKSFVGKIDHDDLAYKIFTKYGWKWGGDFEYVKDYQHFYKEILDDKIRERID